SNNHLLEKLLAREGSFAQLSWGRRNAPDVMPYRHSVTSALLRRRFVADGAGFLLPAVELGAAAGDLIGRQAVDIGEIELPIGARAPDQRRLHRGARAGRGLQHAQGYF